MATSVRTCARSCHQAGGELEQIQFLLGPMSVLIAGFLSQGLGEGAHGVLRASIDRHRRYDLNSGRRNDIDEMSETLSKYARCTEH